MNSRVLSLLKLQAPLSAAFEGSRANYFNAVQIFRDETVEPQFLGPQEFVEYLAENFRQLGRKSDGDDVEGAQVVGCVTVIWSRSSDTLPLGSIDIKDVAKRKSGYPFGLIIEHAFIRATESRVFQKRDPTPHGPYELKTFDEAVAPYLGRAGFELTHHEPLFISHG